MSEHTEPIDERPTGHGPVDAEPTAPPAAAAPPTEAIDLDGIERDLNDVQAALERLNDGTYWIDEVTGEPIPDDVLATRPTVRSVS